MGKMIKWTDDYIWQAYIHARTGISDHRLSGVLGLTDKTLTSMRKRKPALENAINAARTAMGAIQSGVGAVETFQGYVYGRLAGPMQKLWDDIQWVNDSTNTQEELESLFEGHPDRVRQHMFFQAFIHCNFNTSAALRCIGTGMNVYRKWRETDERFVELVKEFHEHKKDFFEGALCNLVAAHNAPAVIFANKTINRDRGYGEKLEVEHTGQVSQDITLNMNELDLSIEVRREILKAIRDKDQKDRTTTPEPDGNVQRVGRN